LVEHDAGAPGLALAGGGCRVGDLGAVGAAMGALPAVGVVVLLRVVRQWLRLFRRARGLAEAVPELVGDGLLVLGVHAIVLDQHLMDVRLAAPVAAIGEPQLHRDRVGGGVWRASGQAYLDDVEPGAALFDQDLRRGQVAVLAVVGVAGRCLRAPFAERDQEVPAMERSFWLMRMR